MQLLYASNYEKKMLRKLFPDLRNMHSDEGKDRRISRYECYLYCKCRSASKILFQVKVCLSDTQLLSRKPLYLVLVSLARVGSKSSVQWVYQNTSTVAIGIRHDSFHCNLVRQLRRQVKDYMVRVPNRILFVMGD